MLFNTFSLRGCKKILKILVKKSTYLLGQSCNISITICNFVNRICHSSLVCTHMIKLCIPVLFFHPFMFSYLFLFEIFFFKHHIHLILNSLISLVQPPMFTHIGGGGVDLGGIFTPAPCRGLGWIVGCGPLLPTPNDNRIFFLDLLDT